MAHPPRRAADARDRIVYIVAFVAFIEFLNLTLTPLINEIVQFIKDFPRCGPVPAASSARRDLRAAADPAGDPRVDRPVIAGIGQGGRRAPTFDFGFLLPLITGAGSFLGAIFGYIILPVWVFYLLKDRVALTAPFDRALPAAWRFDVWAVLRIVERVFGQWVRGQLILGLAVGVATFIGLMVLSASSTRSSGGTRSCCRSSPGSWSSPDHRADHLGRPRGPARGDGRLEAGHRRAASCTRSIQQVENNFLVPEDPGRRGRAPPGAVMFALVIGGAIAGLLGAILALPITAAFRDVVRYLFRRAG